MFSTSRFSLLLLSTALVASCTSTTHFTRQGESSTTTQSEDWSRRLVDPVSSPTTFESPVVNSEVRPIFIHQELPTTSVFGGGDFQLYAVQARYAITDELAFIATKDGYIDFNPKLGTQEEGFADIAAGLKYAAVSNPNAGLLVTPGIIYEVDSGDHEVFQGRGDGLIRPFVSAGVDCNELNVLAAVGLNLPLHGAQETTSVDYHLHVDYEIEERFFPLAEINGITYLDDGSALPFNFEGGDLINLGSNNVDGNTVVTGAVGGRCQLAKSAHVGAVYEFPMTSREDLFDSRVTVDFIWSF